MNILDFIFPKYCISCKTLGVYICSTCFAKLYFSTQFTCLTCGEASYDGLTHNKCISYYSPDGAFSSLEYKSLAKRLIYQFKYKPYLSDLSKALGELLYEGIIQHESLMKEIIGKDVWCTAIPAYISKKNTRGYNQAELLAKNFVKHMNIQYCDLLKRTKDTKPQITLSKQERKENMVDAFEFKGKTELTGKVILLVDDVLTTGSTLFYAAKILKKNGAKKVFGVTLARD